MSDQYPVIELSKFKKGQKRDYFSSTSPFAIYFVYSPSGNFVVKGMSNEVEKFVTNHFPKCVYRYTYWQHGKSRGGWASTLNIFFHQETTERIGRFYPKQGRNKMVICIHPVVGKAIEFKVRSVPHRWLPVYEQASRS